MSLLERARAVPVRIGRSAGPTDERIELALAWLRGDITITQAAVALESAVNGATYAKLTTALREAHRRGLLSIAERPAR